MDWDDAYQNGAYVPGSAEYPERWAAAAAAYRGQGGCELDVPYGEGERRRMDVFWPDAPPVGLAVFIHGGYWLKFDKSYWSHLAAGARTRGWVVCLPSYPLAPEARLSEMTASIAQAVTTFAGMAEGPIHISGHSAGGHLASRMACEGVLPQEVAARVEKVVSISGLHDLGPLRKTAMNGDLKIDDGEEQLESAIHQTPIETAITAWVGGDERPEFIRQTHLLGDAWQTKVFVDPGKHHFDVIEGLTDPSAALTEAFVG
ncbi:MAG: alpha/beta hydrolase [Pseudomonadota bacterium]